MTGTALSIRGEDTSMMMIERQDSWNSGDTILDSFSRSQFTNSGQFDLQSSSRWLSCPKISVVSRYLGRR